jgi:hypothetical protein
VGLARREVQLRPQNLNIKTTRRCQLKFFSELATARRIDTPEMDLTFTRRGKILFAVRYMRIGARTVVGADDDGGVEVDPAFFDEGGDFGAAEVASKSSYVSPD